MSMKYCMSAVAVAATMMIAPGVAQAQQKMTYATYATPGWATVQTDLWFMEELKKRTNGALEFETYYGGALLKPAEIIPGVGQGAAQIGHISPQYNLNLLPLSDVVQPFTTENVAAASLAFNDLYTHNKDVAAEYEKINLKLLYALVPAEMVFYTNKTIEGPQDLKGMRIRANTNTGEAINRLGGTAVGVAWTEALDVFQRGGLDGLANVSFDVAIASGVHELASDVTNFGGVGVYATLITIMNLDTYNALSPEVRKVVDELSAEAPVKFVEINDKVMEGAADKLAATKVKVTMTKDEDLATYQGIAEGLREKWVADLEAKGKPAKAVLDEFLGYVREREKTSTYELGLEKVMKKRGDQ